jgi:hypothetical protein
VTRESAIAAALAAGAFFQDPGDADHAPTWDFHDGYAHRYRGASCGEHDCERCYGDDETALNVFFAMATLRARANAAVMWGEYPEPECGPDCPECAWIRDRDERAIDAPTADRAHGVARSHPSVLLLSDERARARGATRNRRHRRERMRWRAEVARGLAA